MKLSTNIAGGADKAGLIQLSTLGGLSQFGAYLDVLAPGAMSSDRHWHDSEDEFLYLWSGQAVLEDDFGRHELEPGDAVSWPYGVANGHHILNLSDKPCSFLILGSRVAGDRCHYPDSGKVQINEATTWRIEDAAGRVLKGGDLPNELLNLPPRWGQRGEGPFQRLNRARDRAFTPAEDVPHLILGGGNGPYSYALLSDPGGISQFGAFIEALPPGSRSGFRHWHEAEDEMVVMLEGEVVLHEDADEILRPGDVACWPAGHPVGHCLENPGPGEARYLVIGTRHLRDVIHYPDHDLVAHKDGPARAWFHADGRKREA